MISTLMAQQLKLLVLDVDGVLTDGTLYIDERGEAFKSFNVRDGIAVQLLRRHGIEVGVLSGKSSRALDFRCRQLGIDLAAFGCKNKHEGVRKLTSEIGVDLHSVAFCGDDVIDLPPIDLVGFSACPADAHRLVMERSDVVLSTPGGRGVVRELADLILEARCGSLLAAYDCLLSDFAAGNVTQIEQ